MKNHLRTSLLFGLIISNHTYGQFENGLKKNEISISISGTILNSSYHPQFKSVIGSDYFVDKVNIDSSFSQQAFVSNANATSPSFNFLHWFTKSTSRWTHGIAVGVGFRGIYSMENGFVKSEKFNIDTLKGETTNTFVVIDSVDVLGYQVSNEGKSMSAQIGWKLNLALSKHWQLRTGITIGSHVNFKSETYYSHYQSSNSELTVFSDEGIHFSSYQDYTYQQEKMKVDAVDLGKFRSSYVIVPIEVHYLFHVNMLKSKPVFGVYTSFTNGIYIVSYNSVRTASYNWNAHLGLSYYF